jgi:hypothetical protein
MTEEEKAAFDCVDCGVSTHEIGEYYMVTDDIWINEAKMKKQGGMLCLGCLEERIGRKLHGADFPDYPINAVCLPDFLWNRERSERFKNRLERTRHGTQTITV